MYWSSPLRSTLNTGCITGVDMCKVCTEAVQNVAPWTRVTLQVWTCVSMYWSSPLRSALNTGYITGVDMCKVCTEAVCTNQLAQVRQKPRRKWYMIGASEREAQVRQNARRKWEPRASSPATTIHHNDKLLQVIVRQSWKVTFYRKQSNNESQQENWWESNVWACVGNKNGPQNKNCSAMASEGKVWDVCGIMQDRCELVRACIPFRGMRSEMRGLQENLLNKL